MSNSIKIISRSDERSLLSTTKNNPKYNLIVLLMLDAGLRVSEVISLKYSNLNFSNKEITLASLKKRSDKPVYRSIPMSYRLFDSLSKYIGNSKIVADNYLFPSKVDRGHIGRIPVWRKLKRLSDYTISPHMLRHTFGTRIAKENDLIVTRDLLGHSSVKTTEIYTHSSYIDKSSAIKSIDKISAFEKVRRMFVKQRYIGVQNVINSDIKTVGRLKELDLIRDSYEKKYNLFIKGDQGIGKSHLLSGFKELDNVLYLDDFKMVKVTLVNLLKHLSDNCDKKTQIELYSGTLLSDNYLTKSSVLRLVDLILAVVGNNEFTLVIDDVTAITKNGVIVLEKLKNKFHMIVAGRRVKIDYSSFLSNFQQLEIRALSRNDSSKFIYLMSNTLRDRIEDYQSFKNYVFDQGNGNPLFMKELIERLSKEQYISSTELGNITHIHSKHYIDFTLPIIICLSSLMVLRYIGGELGHDAGAFKLFGGVFLVFALFARSLFQISRRRYV